jgi:hypothetical protein
MMYSCSGLGYRKRQSTIRRQCDERGEALAEALASDCRSGCFAHNHWPQDPTTFCTSLSRLTTSHLNISADLPPHYLFGLRYTYTCISQLLVLLLRLQEQLDSFWSARAYLHEKLLPRVSFGALLSIFSQRYIVDFLEVRRLVYMNVVSNLFLC